MVGVHPWRLKVRQIHSSYTSRAQKRYSAIGQLGLNRGVDRARERRKSKEAEKSYVDHPIMGPHSSSFTLMPSAPSKHTQYPYVIGTSVLGIKYKDGVLLASDTAGSYGSTVKYKSVGRMKQIGKTTLVRRAEQAGFKAIVLTVDTARLGRREADIKNRFKLPSHLTYKNMEGLMNLEAEMDKTSDSEIASWVDNHFDRSLNWKDVKWLQSITKLPVFVKGILIAEDAVLALQAGVAGIMVSNHGAWQPDHVPATISVLEEVGRPIPYALAVDGEAGVTKVLQMLRDEFELTMALMGVRSVKEICRQHVQTEQDTMKLLLSKL